MTGVDEARKVWRPGSCTPTQTHAQTTTVCVAGDGAGAHQTLGAQGGGGRGRRAGCEIILIINDIYI